MGFLAAQTLVVVQECRTLLINDNVAVLKI